MPKEYSIYGMCVCECGGYKIEDVHTTFYSDCSKSTSPCRDAVSLRSDAQLSSCCSITRRYPINASCLNIYLSNSIQILPLVLLQHVRRACCIYMQAIQSRRKRPFLFKLLATQYKPYIPYHLYGKQYKIKGYTVFLHSFFSCCTYLRLLSILYTDVVSSRVCCRFQTEKK